MDFDNHLVRVAYTFDVSTLYDKTLGRILTSAKLPDLDDLK